MIRREEVFKVQLYEEKVEEVLFRVDLFTNDVKKCSKIIYLTERPKKCWFTYQWVERSVQIWFMYHWGWRHVQSSFIWQKKAEEVLFRVDLYINEVDEVLKVNLFCWVDADGRLASGPEAVDGLSVARQGVRPAKLHVLDRKIININGRVYLYSFLFIYLSVYLYGLLISFTFIYSTACPLIFVSSI